MQPTPYRPGEAVVVAADDSQAGATSGPNAIRVVAIHPRLAALWNGYKRGVCLGVFLLVLGFVLLSPHPSAHAHVPAYEAQQAESAHWQHVIDEEEATRQAEDAAHPGSPPYPSASYVPSAQAPWHTATEVPATEDPPLPTPGNGQR